MKEQWEIKWKDYYAILGLEPDADQKDITRVYRDKAFLLGPDRLQNEPERIRRRAEEELKRVNEAYEVLSKPERRAKYDDEWNRRVGASASGATWVPKPPTPPPPKPPRPKVEIDPPMMKLQDLPKGETPIISFVVNNSGGPWTDFEVRTPRHPKHPKHDQHHWLSMHSLERLSEHSELPCRVRLKVETTGLTEALLHEAEVFVSLDDEKATFKIYVTVAPPAKPPVDVPRPSGDWLFSWLAPGWQLSLALLSSVGGIQLIFHQNPWLTVSGVALVVTTLYSLVETNWLKRVSSASSIVKSAVTASIIAGFLTAIVAAMFGVIWVLGIFLVIVVLYFLAGAVRA